MTSMLGQKRPWMVSSNVRSIPGVDCFHTAGMENVGFLVWMDWRMLVSPFVSELYI